MQIWLKAGENASTHTVKKTCAFFSLDDDRIYQKHLTSIALPLSLFWLPTLAHKN